MILLDFQPLSGFHISPREPKSASATSPGTVVQDSLVAYESEALPNHTYAALNFSRTILIHIFKVIALSLPSGYNRFWLATGGTIATDFSCWELLFKATNVCEGD